ncbi:hypothetical protein H9L39_08020 [Fusarium oxysporum f. sp. albedinis]|nr:hypothetical protein H9L39_08020 [Fusarium oxysporum f. sp. albedinis]
MDTQETFLFDFDRSADLQVTLSGTNIDFVLSMNSKNEEHIAIEREYMPILIHSTLHPLSIR